jgi:iron complex outermembrane receptor protein
MLEGSATAGESHPLWTNLDGPTAAEEPIIEARSEAEAGHLLARWTHRRAGGASLQVQAFVDLAARREPVADYHRRTIDVETQYHVPLGGRHDLVAGIGYRLNADNYGGRGGFSLHPNAAQAFRFTTFVQDEIALLQDRLALTLGTHIQYESDARAGLQPNARLIWKVRPRQRLWTSASRALRSASRYERGIRVDFPPVLTPAGLPLTVNVLGNPDVQAETFMDLEAGYRLEVAQTAGMSITAFRGSYRNLQTQETSPPIIQFVPGPELHVTTTFGNLLTASTRGIEAAAYWSPASAWRLDASYAALRVTPQLSALSTDPTAGIDEGRAPRSQWQMRSTFSPGARTSVGASLFHVSALRWAQVPAYTRADVSAEWRLSPRLSAMVIGQNLLDRAHPEFTSVGSLLLATQVPRSVSIRLRWVSR